MAKKPAAKITTSFNELNDLMNKLGGDGDILENASFAKIDEWIPTGYYILNAAFSGSLFGGIPNRRSIAFAGEQGCLQKDEEIEIYILKNPKISQHHEKTIFT